jgi:NAD-dependent SIR2 family protein deacetylase
MGVDSGLPDFRGSTGLFKDRSVAMSYEAAAGDLQNPWGFGRSWPLSSFERFIYGYSNEMVDEMVSHQWLIHWVCI